jgi:hypothetical protein
MFLARGDRMTLVMTLPSSRTGHHGSFRGEPDHRPLGNTATCAPAQ